MGKELPHKYYRDTTIPLGIDVTIPLGDTYQCILIVLKTYQKRSYRPFNNDWYRWIPHDYYSRHMTFYNA